jgi:hypothetical protein
MSTFESLEDSFIKKSSEGMGTDFDEAQRSQYEAEKARTNVEETYEETLKKKNVKSGLAAMFEEKLKNARESVETSANDSEESDNTVTFTTNSVRYEDEVMIPQNEVSEEDIQRFYPHEKYNDVFISPDNTPVKEDVRFAETNKYGDMLNQFEPRTAAAEDITEGRSVSSISAPGEPSMNPSEDEVLEHIKTHRQKKSETILTETDDISSTKGEAKETELTEDTYLNTASATDVDVGPTEPPFKYLQNTGQVDPTNPIIPEELNVPTDITRPPFKVQQDAVENQQEQESSEEDSSETE